jgi:hypothetical protein
MEAVTWWKPERRGSSHVVPPLAGQEMDNPAPGPDMDPPPDDDLYEIDADDRASADDDGLPPFTGEDLEDADDHRDDRLPPLPTM